MTIKPLMTPLPFGFPLFTAPAITLFPPPTFIDDSDISIKTEGCVGCPPGPPGSPGISVVNAEVKENPGDLIITLSDGTEINAGNVIGPQGDQGPKGDQGPPGSCSDLKTVLVSENYTASEEDCYIGVNSKNPVTIKLTSTQDGKMYIIKSEMSAPVGNRKVTITGGISYIDGNPSVVLQEPYESITLLYRGNSWHVI